MNLNEDEQLLWSVNHLRLSDVHKVLVFLARKIFTEEELIMSSKTGKKTSKCNGDPILPFDMEKLERLERVVGTKTSITKELFVNKLENLQK